MSVAGLSELHDSPPVVAPRASVAAVIAEALYGMGVRRAFGITGGGVVALFSALDNSGIEVLQTRHEAGAAFMALESSLADGRAAVVFTTTGPGLSNALTGLMAARVDGARVIVVGGLTPATQRGRAAFQETSNATVPFLCAGPVFHHVSLIERAEQTRGALSQLGAALRRPGGFVGALLAPMDVQATRIDARAWPGATPPLNTLACPPALIRAAARRLNEAPFVMWVGWGARGAAEQVRLVAERTGAMVMASPRGKGVFPEEHPQYLGVTGLGGHRSVEGWFASQRPGWILVLGSRLGENTSGAWGPGLRPGCGYVHVDVDPCVPGAAIDDRIVVPVTADCATFLADIFPHLHGRGRPSPCAPVDVPAVAARPGFVRPEALMAAVQTVVIDEHDAVVISEAGNAFAWASHALRFRRAGRYRVSSGFGAMGHASAGVVGAAVTTGRRCVAVLGDGALLMNSELTTAVAARAPATWVVLNDSSNGMVASGMEAVGYPGHDVDIPAVDFVGWARSQGVAARSVDDEEQVADALRWALHEPGPSLLTVTVRPGRVAPLGARFSSINELTTAAAPALHQEGRT